MTQKWYATLRHPKMYQHTKFGIPTSKDIEDMDRTRKRDGRTDGLMDGRTVRLLYASQSSFRGIKNLSLNIPIITFKTITCYLPCSQASSQVTQLLTNLHICTICSQKHLMLVKRYGLSSGTSVKLLIVYGMKDFFANLKLLVFQETS